MPATSPSTLWTLIPRARRHHVTWRALSGRPEARDLRRCKLAGNFFNVLFNLNKFIAFETRDPFLIRQEREEPTLTEWDRFARAEYIRLSMEEEEGQVDGGEGWDDTMDPPF